MPRRINWEGMYNDLSEVIQLLGRDVAEHNIQASLTLGRKPPRIYVIIHSPTWHSFGLEDLSPEEEEERRLGIIELGKVSAELTTLTKARGLRGYKLDGHRADFTRAFGYEHEIYRVT